MADEKLLRIRDVAEMVGLCRSEIYTRVAEGTFPAPVLIAPKISRFLNSEVQTWIAARVLTCPRSTERRAS
jgi:prophage regulatory protein